MKKIIIPLFISLFSLSSFAQESADSAKISVTLQARDCEYLGFFVAHNMDYEDLFDAIKSKFRVTNAPSGTNSVVIDSIYIIQWLRVSQRLRDDPYAIGGNVYSRVDAALRALNNSHLTSRLNEMNDMDTEIFMGRRQLGRFKLRRQ
jgi:hypothetical protein